MARLDAVADGRGRGGRTRGRHLPPAVAHQQAGGPGGRFGGRPAVKAAAGLFIGAVVLGWVAVAYPAWRLGGATALQMSAVAAALCLVPAIATFVWGLRA